MSALRRIILVTVSVMAVRAPLVAQAAPPIATAPRLDSIARRIVTAAKYATFITVDATGQPQVRTVQPAAPDSLWQVWFATNPRTRKVGEVARQPRVALHYFDPTTESYVALTGRARLVRDRRTKDAHWDPAWTAFYRNRDADAVLIVVEAAKVEVVSPRLGVNNDQRTWLPQSFVPSSLASRGRRP